MPDSKLQAVEPRYELMFDCDRLQVGCVLIQAAFRCDSSLVYRFGFDTKTWFLAPTPGMRRIGGTEREWRMAAAMANAELNKGKTDD